MKLSNHQLAYHLARITLGLNFFLHGLVRLPHWSNFASSVAKGFSKTLLPTPIAEVIAFGIPIIEILLGILLLVGIFIRKTLTATAIFMMLLLAGCALKEDWNAVAIQMLYALYIYVLLNNLQPKPNTKL